MKPEEVNPYKGQLVRVYYFENNSSKGVVSNDGEVYRIIIDTDRELRVVLDRINPEYLRRMERLNLQSTGIDEQIRDAVNRGDKSCVLLVKLQVNENSYFFPELNESNNQNA